MVEKGRGQIAGAGRRKGEFVGWDEGLTDSDKAHLQVVADHTDEVIEQLGFAIARALEAVGIQAESDAAKICPVDTGRLKNSITHTIDADDDAAIIGTNVEYALFVHENRKHPQRFLTDAVTQNADKYRRIIEAALRGS